MFEVQKRERQMTKNEKKYEKNLRSFGVLMPENRLFANVEYTG